MHFHRSSREAFAYPSNSDFDPAYPARKQTHAGIATDANENWIKIILAFARHKRLWSLRVEQAEVKNGEWSEIFWNPRINRKSTFFPLIRGCL